MCAIFDETVRIFHSENMCTPRSKTQGNLSVAKTSLRVLLENASATGKVDCAQQNLDDAPNVVLDEFNTLLV